MTEADLLLHVLDASSPQVLQQRQAVLGVLRGLGVSQQRLQEDVIEVWNKVDMLPSSSSCGSSSSGSVEGPEEQQQQQEEQEGAAGVAVAGAAISGGSGEENEEAATTRRGTPDSSGTQEAAAAAEAAGGALPPTVAALLEAGSGGQAADYCPTALATSVVQGRGLGEVLAAVESKVSLCKVAMKGCG